MTFFYKNSQPPYFSNISFRIGETPVLDTSNPPELPGFTKEPVVYLTFSNVFVDNGLRIRKTGCLVFFLRTAIRSLKNRGDIGKQLVAGSNARPTVIYIHLGVLGDCIFVNPGAGRAFCFPLVFCIIIAVKDPLPSQNVSQCSLECMVPTCSPE